MKVVVSGATGFVGSAVARALAARGDRVLALARADSDRWRLADTAVSWHTAALDDLDALSAALGGADAVIHAAGRLGQFGATEAEYMEVHAAGTAVVCRAVMAQPKAPRLLHISSPGVLGPIDGAPASEERPPAPSNAYERSKAAAEKVVQQYAAQGLPAVIVRPEFIYGPRDTHVLGLFRAIQRGRFFYIGDGRNICHPTYIGDAVAGIIAALDHGHEGQTYHVAGPRPLTFRELGETIAAALGVAPPRHTLPVPVARAAARALEGAARLSGMTPPLSRDGVAFFSESRAFSWAKAQRELAFKPQTDFVEGCNLTVAWYREQGYL